MKKFSRLLITTALVMAFIPIQAFAKTDSSPRLISEKEVVLTASSTNTGKATTAVNTQKEFTLKSYDDNGTTVYEFGDVDREYRQSAMDYIMKSTGDARVQENTYSGPLWAGESKYLNHQTYDGDATSYAWKENYVNAWGEGKRGNNFSGGQSAGWFGSNTPNFIILNQGISVSGIMVTISWPPSVSGSGNSSSWQSQPLYTSVGGASFTGFFVGGTAFSTTFNEGGDIYFASRIYRPVTYIKYSII
ncbi:MAG: hypothetical protein K0S61_2794 [Anaerocolumna sp.]|jgi:hypothetical protein|nr:hypothetical protein [Anaerocolumna sp.]